MRATILLSACASALVLAGCATMDHSASRAESAATLANAPTLAASTGAVDVAAGTAMYFGDRWTATNLFEHAEDGSDSVVRRYNLAQAYESTGRLSEAANLYRTLVADGQFKKVLARDESGRLMRANMADQAAERLAAIEPQLAYASAEGAVAAGDLGTPVSATVGGPAGGISDAEAMRRDAVENPIR